MSTRLGVGDKEGILDDFNRLYGRLYKATPCPMDDDDLLVTCVNTMVPETYRKLARAMHARGYRIDAWFRSDQEFTTPVDGKLVWMFFNIGYESDPFDRFMYRPRLKDGRDWHAITPELFREAFGPHTDEMLQWGLNRAMLTTEMQEAWETTSKIVEMTSTAGQIKRMVPQLLDYLPKDKADALREQKRSSSVPYEWGAFDRHKVQRMLTALAKCHIMPASRRDKFTDQPQIRAALMTPESVAEKEGTGRPEPEESESDDAV